MLGQATEATGALASGTLSRPDMGVSWALNYKGTLRFGVKKIGVPKFGVPYFRKPPPDIAINKKAISRD